MLRRLLFHGSRKYEIEAASQRRASPHAVRFTDRYHALAQLRRLAAEPANLLAMRGLLAEMAAGGAVERLDDDAALDCIAALLTAGRAVLIERSPAPPLTGLDGEREEAPAAPSSARAPRAARTWIEVQLIGEDGKPIPGELVRIEAPDGAVHERRLNDEGFVRVDGIDPGSCTVTFPALDEEAWVPIGTAGAP